MDPDAELASNARTSTRRDQDIEGLRQRWRIWNILPRALAVMENLKLFRFREVNDRRSAHWILANPDSTFKFQLEELQWGCYEEPAEDLVRFMETQKSLKMLYLCGGISCSIPPSACPDMVSIQGESAAVAKLLPGRPNITEVYWNPTRFRGGNGEPAPGIQILPAMLLELRRVRRLSIYYDGSSPAEPTLTKLVEWMPALVVLEVYHLLREDLQVVGNFQNLERLVIISGDSMGSSRATLLTTMMLFAKPASHPLRNAFIKLAKGKLPNHKRYEGLVLDLYHWCQRRRVDRATLFGAFDCLQNTERLASEAL